MIICVNYLGDADIQPELKTVAIEINDYFAWPYI